MKNRAVILADIITDDDSGKLKEEVADTLIQVESVHKALAELGYEAERLKFTENLDELKVSLEALTPDFVFNLVEEEKNIIIAPLFLENLGIIYTGCPASSIHFTNHKILFKKIFGSFFKHHGINIPAYASLEDDSGFKPGLKYIIKAVDKNSSAGLDDSAVITADSEEEITELLIRKKEKTGMDFFAEEFIDGREFNIAVLNRQIMPAAEIVFENYPPDKVKIVGYSAKWESGSFEYSHTVRNFDFKGKDLTLVKRINNIASICTSGMNINGYHRYDFRVDKDGTPFLLEINANPCLSMDAGFFTSANLKGYSYTEMIKLIIDEMLYFRHSFSKKIGV